MTTFVGGMNVPTHPGRGNASIPLACLSIEGDRVVITARTKGFVPLDPFEVLATDVIAAFPLRGRLLTAGVGLETKSGTAYFWTHEQPRVLAALEAAGVRIDPTKRRASKKWWSA